jgi:hypothetical protein
MGVEQCLLFSSRVSDTFDINQFLTCRYCDGGELFNYIIEKRYLSENVAAHIMR